MIYYLNSFTTQNYVDGQNCSGSGASREYLLPNNDIDTKAGISYPDIPKEIDSKIDIRS